MNQVKKSGSNFSAALALVDLIPVLIFLASALVIGLDINSVVFTVGAVFCTIAGLCKVFWKLSAACGHREARQLNALFLPLMIVGFLLLVIGLVLSFANGTLNSSNLKDDVFSFPAIIFIGFGIVFLCLMGVLRVRHTKAEFQTEAAVNWKAEFINIAAQTCILLGIIFARIH